MTERRDKRRVKYSVLSIIIVGVIGAAIWFYWQSAQEPAEPVVTTLSVSQLEKVLDIAEFSSLESVYNAVATQYDDGAPVYYVAYQGKITAGIDYTKIQIDYLSETKQITITLPEPEIIDTIVDMGTLEYIFIDSSYNTEFVSIDAYQLCVDDLKKRAAEEEDLLAMAKDSAIDTTRALFEPWIHQLDGDYMLVVQ